MTQPIAACLWFPENAAEAAVDYYCSIFDDSSVQTVYRFTDNVPDPTGEVVFIEFRINGQDFQALNGRPDFTFNDSVSFSIFCKDQAELDRYWNALVADGTPIQCGWLKDKYGVSWQIVPARLKEMFVAPDRAAAGRAMAQMLEMVKLDIAPLEAAFAGE